MSEQQLWVGYYQQTYTNHPNIYYFGHLIGFAESRDAFQQKIEAYKIQYQCKLISQLVPLPATIWFQRHGYQANIWSAAQQLNKEELRFLLLQEETHSEKISYLSQESVTLSPLPTIFDMHTHRPPYLPEALMFHPFFAQLNSRDNPKEGLRYGNLNFTANSDTYRYYAVIDGVKSLTLPHLCAHEGQTDSLYQGELKDKMDRYAPYLTRLTVTDQETSPFVQVLFTRAEKEWFGAWDNNPTILIRSRQGFNEVAYHLRKFTHLYKAEGEKWYFFRFYDPRVLVAYLQHIEHQPARLAAFFGFRGGESVIESFAARIENRFYIFSLKALPAETRPSAVSFDNHIEQFLADYDKRRLLEKLQREIIPAEFSEQKIKEPDIERYFNFALDRGFKHTDAITDLVKAQIYLSNQQKLSGLIKQAEDEFGTNFPLAVANAVYTQAKTEKKG
ncbi:DUF4123 domain-containing protein [Aggregatibacter actinomycetemcomitans]|uniref:DUF4123 domain-containing protein n=1 Tax=Aggregatibacter actinomycetemcomitans TaxID=714 RepID=UPI001F121AAD|nr:DUF4123 domain-containing protein [Aggregatibacter actinomycetemcomitans]